MTALTLPDMVGLVHSLRETVAENRERAQTGVPHA